MSEPGLLHDILAQPASIQRLLGHLEAEGRTNLMAAAEHLRAGRRVILSGMGASLFACTPLSLLLARRGILAPVVEAAELLHHQLELCRDTTVVLVSRSGETVEITRLLALLPQRGCHIIGVTTNPGSRLAEQADTTIEVRTNPDTLVAIQSYTGTVFALLALGAAMADDFNDSWRKQVSNLVDPWKRCLDEQLGASEQWQDFFKGIPVIYLTGRGPSLGSALQGALLFNEAAKLPSAGVSAANFRHGSVEVVDSDFHGLILAGQPATRHLDIGLALDVERFRGQVRVIGPAAALAGKLPANRLWSIPNVPEVFVPLIELTPIQIAVYRTALWRNVELNRFRYAGPVALDEERL